MSSKFLRKTAAKGCPVHQAILETAGEELETHGVFSKEGVLQKSGMGAMSEAIRWDYIIEFLREEQNVELVPVREAFFRRYYQPLTKNGKPAGPRQLTEKAATQVPQKFLAAGHGVRTAGWASVAEEKNAALAIHRLRQRKKMANGTGKAFFDYRDAILKRASQQVIDHPAFKELTEIKSA